MLRRSLGAALLAGPAALAFADVVGYVARVEGISMQPALNPDADRPDYVFLSRARDPSDYRRGDVVSLIAPKDPDKIIIKRIVALHGDVVRTVRIPEGHCWLEGDHKGRTHDSNAFGPVSLGLLTARAASIVWPPSRWRTLR